MLDLPAFAEALALAWAFDCLACAEGSLQSSPDSNARPSAARRKRTKGNGNSIPPMYSLFAHPAAPGLLTRRKKRHAGNQIGSLSGNGMECAANLAASSRTWVPPAASGTLFFSGVPRRARGKDFPQPSMIATIQSVAGEQEPHPDLALVERVKAGDISAYDELVRKYERQIFRIAQHITQNREDAEDVMQDAFLKAYEKLEQFQGNAKFYTWLVRIAVNESLMRLRKRRTGRTVSMDEDIETEEGRVPRDFADWAPDPEQNYDNAELSEILRKTIQGLPRGFRVVFALRDIEGLSTEETAEALNLSVPAVKSRLLRARLQLRERLSRHFRPGGKAAAPPALQAGSPAGKRA